MTKRRSRLRCCTRANCLFRTHALCLHVRRDCGKRGGTVAESLDNAAFQPRESGTPYPSDTSGARRSGLEETGSMNDLTFKPVGAAMAALVAGLAPASVHAEAPK